MKIQNFLSRTLNTFNGITVLTILLGITNPTNAMEIDTDKSKSPTVKTHSQKNEEDDIYVIVNKSGKDAIIKPIGLQFTHHTKESDPYGSFSSQSSIREYSFNPIVVKNNATATIRKTDISTDILPEIKGIIRLFAKPSNESDGTSTSLAILSERAFPDVYCDGNCKLIPFQSMLIIVGQPVSEPYSWTFKINDTTSNSTLFYYHTYNFGCIVPTEEESKELFKKDSQELWDYYQSHSLMTAPKTAS